MISRLQFQFHSRSCYFSRFSAALSLVTIIAFAMLFTTGVARADDYTTMQSCNSVSFSQLTRTGDGATIYKALVISACQDCVKQGKLFRYLTKGAANDTGTCLVAPPVTPPPVKPPPVTLAAGREYKLTYKPSNKALDVFNGSTAAGGFISQYPWTGYDNQRWVLKDAGGGYFYLISKKSNLVLDVTGASKADGAEVAQWGNGGGENQKWLLEPTSDGYHLLINKNSGKALQIQGASVEVGKKVVQWTKTSEDKFKWKIEEAPAEVVVGKVTSIKCSGSIGNCIAKIAYGDGLWYAQWKAGVPQKKIPANMGFVDITETNCSSDTKLCISKLNFGDGNWTATFPVTISRNAPSDSSYVNMLKFQCSGSVSPSNCMVQLDFGGGSYLAEFAGPVKHP